MYKYYIEIEIEEERRRDRESGKCVFVSMKVNKLRGEQYNIQMGIRFNPRFSNIYITNNRKINS